VHALALATRQLRKEPLLEAREPHGAQRLIRNRKHQRLDPCEARYRGTEQYDLENGERKGQRGRLRHDGAPARELARRNALEVASVDAD
jgi:hypothetical protein